MEIINTDTINEEDLKQNIQEYKEYIENLTLENLVTRLETSLISTEVILEGFNIINNITENQGISLAGIIRLREAIIETIDWIDFNLNANTEENDEL